MISTPSRLQASSRAGPSFLTSRLPPATSSAPASSSERQGSSRLRAPGGIHSASPHSRALGFPLDGGRFILIQSEQQDAGEAVFDVGSALLENGFRETGPFLVRGGPEPQARDSGDVGGAARPVGGDDAGGSPGGAGAGPALFDDGDAPARLAELPGCQETHDAATDDYDVAHEMPFRVVGRSNACWRGYNTEAQPSRKHEDDLMTNKKNDGPGEPSLWYAWMGMVILRNYPLW